MKLGDFLSQLSFTDVRGNAFEKIENKYGVVFPEEVRKIISAHTNSVFYDELPVLRALANVEILNASEDMSVDFTNKGIVPLFDIGDNDYIVYDTNEKIWYKFNIVDEVKFDSEKNLVNYFT